MDVERVLAPFGARPHWGKISPVNFGGASSGGAGAGGAGEIVKGLYGEEALRKFRDLASKHDPEGKFQNRFARDVIFS